MSTDRKSLEKALKNFPSSFKTIKDFLSLSKKYLELKLEVLQQELKEQETDKENTWTRMEKCRAYNLLSFLCYLVGNIEDALKYNKESLNVYPENAYPDNVIGLCNRGWFLLITEQKFKEIKNMCQRLDELKTDKTSMAIAKADIAFAYSRLGIQFYSEASKLYSEAILEAEDIEKNLESNELKENICIWSYGCALAQTRLFRTFNVCNKEDLEQPKEKVERVCKLLKHIISSNIESSSCKLLIPRAYVLLGEIASSIESKEILHVGLIQEVLLEDPELTVDGYYEKALKLQNNDIFVLDRCGMRFKFIHDLDKAIEILKKAIAIKESSINHHHLAVAIKEKVQSIPSRDDAVSVSRQLYEVLPHSDREHQEHSARREISAAARLNIGNKKKRLINSPKKVHKLDLIKNKDEIEEILKHLDKAIEIGMNNDAIYDKGLLLRQIGQLKEAEQVFKTLTRNQHRHTSLVVLANSYEQIGYCLQEAMETDKSDDPENDEEDMKMNFKRSLEISCEIVAKIPQLKDCWETAPTLQSLLEGNATTKEALKDLSFLYEKIRQYDKCIDTLKLLVSKAETNEEQIEYGQQIIQDHLKMERFDDSALSFEIICCLPEWQNLVDAKLFVKVFIESAYDSYEKGDSEVANLRFENAFDFCRSKRTLGQSNTKEMEFSVLVLCNPNDENNGEILVEVLNHLGIKSSLNIDGVVGFGRLKSDLLGDVVEQSNHVLVIYDFLQPDPIESKELNEFKKNVDIMRNILSDRGHGNVMTIVPNETVLSNIPKTWSRQHAVYNFSDAESETFLNVLSVKDILINLAIGANS
ncbi:Interferon-induced protein [Mactra antiquata]